MKDPERFTRDELQAISFKSGSMAEMDGLSRFWARAYEDLQVAADRLHAMFARCGEATKREEHERSELKKS